VSPNRDAAGKEASVLSWNALRQAAIVFDESHLNLVGAHVRGPVGTVCRLEKGQPS
jgi:hypothetical protein